MKSKTCGECKHLNRELAFCRVCGARWLNENDGANCKYFEKLTPPTNGDVIRQMSNVELATWGMYDLGTCPTFEKQQTCPKCGECSASEIEECWLAWLNAPAESEVSDE